MTSGPPTSMLEIHLQTQQDGSSAFHEFIASYKSNDNCVYGFVEGKDDPSFYRGFIDGALPSKWNVKLRDVGNKDAVVRLYLEFDWVRFPRDRIAFFIDRDLSPLIGETIPNSPNIYVTDHYSIENDIVCRGTFDRILQEVCELNKLTNKEKDRLLELFEEQKLAFLEALIPVMAWILKWKRNGKKPCLNDIIMNHLFQVKNGKLIKNEAPKGKTSWPAYIHSQCDIVFDEDVSIQDEVVELRKKGQFIKFTRGKYLLWFLVEFSKNVHACIGQLSKTYSESPKMHVSLGEGNAIQLIAPRARIPDSLKQFLNSTYNSYITAKSHAA